MLVLSYIKAVTVSQQLMVTVCQLSELSREKSVSEWRKEGSETTMTPSPESTTQGYNVHTSLCSRVKKQHSLKNVNIW